MSNEEIKRLYQRYLDNDLSSEELNSFLAEFNVDENRIEMNNLMDETWKQMFDSPKAKQTKIVSINRNWFRIAAAAVILIAFVGAYFLFFNHTPKQNMTTKTTIKQDVNPPGVARAMLKLDDGRIVYLDSTRNGSLAVQGKIDILKTAEGQIVYEGSPLVTDHSSLIYNTLVNPRGSKVVSITLTDGTRVWLNSESSLRYPTAFSDKEREVEITGEAYFEVATIHANGELIDANKVPFIVKKGGMEVHVLGTHFNVNAYDDEQELRVTLLEGSVEVKNQNSKVKIVPGQQAILSTIDSKLSTKQNVDLEKVMAWKNGLFSFDGADLASIMRQAARWYDLEIVFQNNIDKHYTVDISRNVPVSKLFQFLEISGGVHFEIQGKKIIVKK